MASSVTMDRVLKNRKMPRKIAPRVPDPLAHGIKLYVDHLEVSRRNRLNIRGWLFHEKVPVAGIMLEIDAGDRIYRRPCRIGAERMDVFEAWGNSHAVHCGFSATKLPSAEGGAVRLMVTLTDGNEIAVPLATLLWHAAGGEWRDVESHVNAPKLDFSDSILDQYLGRRFVAEEGLGATLSVVRASVPPPPPPLPEPVVIMVSVYLARNICRRSFNRSSRIPVRRIISCSSTTATPMARSVPISVRSPPPIVTSSSCAFRSIMAMSAPCARASNTPRPDIW